MFRENEQISLFVLDKKNFLTREFSRVGGTLMKDVDTDQLMRIPDVLKVVREDKVHALFQGIPEAQGWEMPIGEYNVLLAGKELGKGSSRENPAEAIALAGIKLVIAESFGPIFRTNLINNGVLPITNKELLWRAMGGEHIAESEWLAELSDGEKEVWKHGGLMGYMEALHKNQLEPPQNKIPNREFFPHTVEEKYFEQRLGRGVRVKTGDSVVVPVDQIVGYDVFFHQAMEQVRRSGDDTIHFPLENVHIFNDHFRGSTNPDASAALTHLDFFWDAHPNTIRGNVGVYIPQTVLRLSPGELVAGMDSHSLTLAMVPGVLARAGGYSDVAAALKHNGLMAFTLLPTLKFDVVGSLPFGCDIKDAAWFATYTHFRGTLGNNKLFEVGGEAIEDMSPLSLSVLLNMITEWGGPAARVSVYNQSVVNYLRKHGNPLGGKSDDDIREMMNQLQADEGAHYSDQVTFDLSQVVPCMVDPYSHKNVIPLTHEGVFPEINRVIFTSCSGTSIMDLAILVDVLGDREPQLPIDIHPTDPLTITYAKKMGIWEFLMGKKNIHLHTELSCGPCMGHGAAVRKGETVVATNNRNTSGRMGDFDAKVFLGSSVVASITAALGYVPHLDEIAIFEPQVMHAKAQVEKFIK